MPKFNADEKVFELIELTLNGKKYTVGTVDQRMFEKIEEASKNAKEKNSLDVVANQLGIILGVKPSEFLSMDLRKTSPALKFLIKSITDQLEGKEGNV